MTDVGLECLAHSLQHNMVLTELYVCNFYNAKNPNTLTENIVPVLAKCLQNNHTLTELWLPKNLQSSTTSIEEAVNDVRKRRRLPLIKVSGMSVPLNKYSYVFQYSYSLTDIKQYTVVVGCVVVHKKSLCRS